MERRSPPYIPSGKASGGRKRGSTPFEDCREETIMNRDQSKGRIKEAKGKAQEAIGIVKGDRNMEIKGKLRRDLGKAQKVYGNLQASLRNVTTPR
jgi:uncharacterized protein YjbJ (UPF0337 family)